MKNTSTVLLLGLANSMVFASEAEKNKAVYSEINDVLTVQEAQGRFDWLEKCYPGILVEIWENTHDVTQIIKDQDKIDQLRGLWLSERKLADKRVNYLSFSNPDFSNPYDWYPENSKNALCSNMPTEYEAVALQTTILNRKYCDNIASESDLEWIDSVNINGQVHYSNGAPYSFISGKMFTLSRNQQQDFTITATTDDPEKWDAIMGLRVWLDMNHDSRFDKSEMIYGSYMENELSFSVTLPDSAQPGITLMRIAGDAGGGYNDACRSIQFGEVEDYLINIQ